MTDCTAPEVNYPGAHSAPSWRLQLHRSEPRASTVDSAAIGSSDFTSRHSLAVRNDLMTVREQTPLALWRQHSQNVERDRCCMSWRICWAMALGSSLSRMPVVSLGTSSFRELATSHSRRKELISSRRTLPTASCLTPDCCAHAANTRCRL